MSKALLEMELPTSCVGCIIAHPVLGFENICCAVTESRMSVQDCKERRMEDCPLVPAIEDRRLKQALKPCPFCGAVLKYDEYVALTLPGKPIMRLWAHPPGKCILAGLEISKEDHEAWNRRASNERPLCEMQDKKILP